MPEQQLPPWKTATPNSAPRPTGTTLFFRTFLPWQLFRFAWINLKMIRMIGLSHKGELPSGRK